MLKLGTISLDVPFSQAPLSGYTDYPMRKLARSFGAPMTFAGMILAKSAARPDVLKKPAFRPGNDEHPIGAQILGSEPKTMAKAATELERAGYDLIELNFACPAPKVLQKKRGGYLLKEPWRAIEIFHAVREAVSVPLTIKMRTGYAGDSQSRDNFWHITEAAANDGIDALVIHGRSVLRRFVGRADWELLAEIKRRFARMTIIGSGDLFDARTAALRMDRYGVDGVAIARGAIGNPWIFRELRALLTSQHISLPALSERKETMLRHVDLLCEHYEEIKAVRLFRKFVGGYCRSHPRRKTTRLALLAAKNKDELFYSIKKHFNAD